MAPTPDHSAGGRVAAPSRPLDLTAQAGRTAALSAGEARSMRLQRCLANAAAPFVHLFLWAAGEKRLGYAFKDVDAFRRQVWALLDSHDGPFIWAANHLTLWDSFLIYYAIFPFSKSLRWNRIPWSTPEYTNYYKLGNWLQCRLIRAFMYLCRCIPFLRGGDDEGSVRWREKAFEKCIWLLETGGTVFVFPEATRARNGWFEAHRPKDFLGRLALRVPDVKFLCLYMRGETQVGTTAYPAAGETFRIYAELWDPAIGPESTPRSVAEELFRRVGELQERWFASSSMAKNCSGNDVVDLASPLAREHFSPDLAEADPEWAERLLTAKEAAYLGSRPPREVYRTFWRFHAAKEAASKALAQAGVKVLPGGFSTIEVELFQGKARHLPSQLELCLSFTDDDGDKLHCVAVLRGGAVGDGQTPGDVLWRVEAVPPGRSPSDFARELCLELIAGSSDDIPSPASLSFTEIDDIPRVVRQGKPQDWGVSISHSGRFAACSFMVT
ncbi:MAG: 1-acyl-sn-glycerol-3-phosphate acyltransferase [Elusimicrobia bacterium]|nr:1-acyl-sn-glycerol-3-phosphate acyltransferase [Elusimicrobiota bacterium]